MAKERLFHLIEKFAPNTKKLTLKSRIYHDLGIWGDDVDDFFNAYYQEFNVRMDGVDLGEYFPDEGDPISSFLTQLTTGKKSYKQITVQDLLKGIETGALILEE